MVNSLILIDQSSDIKKLIAQITEKKNTKVICFDISSHKKLSELKIEHEKVESYIDTNDEILIDNFIIEKSHLWYQQETISNLLQFDDLNLGWLLELELPPYFLSVLKSFIGIIRIIHKENPSVIITSDYLASLVNIIKKNKTISVISYSSINDQQVLSFNRVAIPINIGTKLYTIWVSRDIALKIKNSVEYLTNLIFNFKFNAKKNVKKSILLLDFNPMLHRSLLNELSKLDENIILLNERRPAVWNIQSLKAIKSSKSKVVILKDLLNPKLQSSILQKRKILQNNIEQFHSNTTLNEFFSIEGYSFWNAIKDDFINTCSKRFEEAIERLELVKNLFEKVDVKCILILYDNAAEEKTILHTAKQYDIPGIILQHGVYVQNRHMERLLPILPIVPPPNVKHALWGNEMKNCFHDFGVLDDDMILTGSSRHDELFWMKNKCENKGHILLASSILTDIFYSGMKIDAFVQFENILKDVCKISINIPNKKLIVKLHPGQYTSFDVRPIIHSIDSSIPIYKTRNISDLMKNCDVLICIGPSTVLLEAMILGKPTITFAVDPQWFYEDKIFKSGATLLVKTPQELESALDNVLSDEMFRNKLIKKGEEFVNAYLVNQGTASEFIRKTLQKNY